MHPPGDGSSCPCPCLRSVKEGQAHQVTGGSRDLMGSNRAKRDLSRLQALAGRMFSEVSKAFIQLIIKRTGSETQECWMLTIILICLLGW